MYNIRELINNLETDWKDYLSKIIDNNESKINELEEFLNSLDCTIYPKTESIFECFNKFNISELKVILIGQDPYHGPNQAMGLSFSVPQVSKVLPPSLRNIYKELNNDIGPRKDRNGDLTYWADQGVLLLNTSLSVTRGKANSHSKYWKWFTDEIIKNISRDYKKIVYLLWGTHARNLKKIMEIDNNYILEATHPSPLGANQGGWFDCKHFSKTNIILKELDKEEIDWLN